MNNINMTRDVTSSSGGAAGAPDLGSRLWECPFIVQQHPLSKKKWNPVSLPLLGSPSQGSRVTRNPRLLGLPACILAGDWISPAVEVSNV